MFEKSVVDHGQPPVGGQQTSLEAAVAYAQQGFSVVAVFENDHADEWRRKRPTGPWKTCQSKIASPAELRKMFAKETGVALVCGAVSGNLEVIDFDDPDLFDPLLKAVRGHDAVLAGKLIVHQTTPSGGAHLLYRCSEPITGNQKLAMNEDGKTVLIETRGQGGYFLIEPSRGYQLHGDLANLPTITKAERDLLLWIARNFDQRPQMVVKPQNEPTGDRPGDVFNRRAEWPELLETDCWQLVGTIGDRTHWTRPGKAEGTSATLHRQMGLFVFSTSTPLPSEKPLDKFGYLAWYRFHGDFGEAARYVRRLYPEEFTTIPTIPTNSICPTDSDVFRQSSDNITTSSDKNRSLSQDVLSFIETEPAPFTNLYLYSELCANSRAEKKAICDALYYYKKTGKIKSIDGKRGHWEVVEEEPEAMDLLSADMEPFNILLPLGISDYAVVRPKGVILISGSNNAGKTVFLLWVCRNFFANTRTHTDPNAFLINEKEKGVAPEILYLNSEMSKQELVARIKCFGDDPALWQQHVKFVERSHSFDKVIKPDGVNFIDFLEVPEDFFLAGKYIADIHKKLESGISLVAMQKKQNSDYAKGGEMTLEKPRLAINLDKNEPHGFTCKITKLKEPKDFKKNIQGMTRDFVITKDSQILPISDWRFVTAKDRDKINAEYARNNLPSLVRSTSMDYRDAPEDGRITL